MSSPADDSNRPVSESLSQTSIKSWADNLGAIETEFNAWRNSLPGGTTTPIDQVEQYLQRVAIVRAQIDSALSQQHLVNELTEARRLSESARQAGADADRASARKERTVVGARTDLAGQWPADTFARALTYVGIAVFGGGTSVLGVVEYLHLGNWVAAAPILWGVSLFFYGWSLKREAENSNRRLDFFDAMLRKSAPDLAPTPRPKPWIWSGR